MFSTPFTCCSIGSATVSITVRALAPGYRVCTCTVGGVTSGYCATGSDHSDTAPMTIIRIASTLARTGRSMKNLEIMARPLLCDAGGRIRRLHLRIDLLSRDRAQDAGDDHAVFGLQAAFD